MARLRDIYLPLGFDDTVCTPTVPTKMRGTSRESQAHRRLKKRLATAAVAAGWHVAYENGPHSFDVVCVDPLRTRVVGLEAVASSGGFSPTSVTSRYAPTFWFFLPCVPIPRAHQQNRQVLRVTPELRSAVGRCLASVPPWEMELPSAWELYNTQPLDEMLRRPEEFFAAGRNLSRFLHTVNAAAQCPVHGDKIVHTLLFISRNDESHLARYGLSREDLRRLLRPRTYELRMAGAGLRVRHVEERQMNIISIQTVRL